jgi:hypothetical protein
MSDREMLELAAKAAGFQNYTIRGDTVYVKTGTARVDSGYYWNPLTDDGDALRLAVRLKITPHIDGNLTDAESPKSFCTEPHFDDPYAATRRAIVRAAAEIGRNMA